VPLGPKIQRRLIDWLIDWLIDCTMQVSLSFSNSEVRPGDKLSLTVGAHRGSYVGVLAVDQSVLLLKGGNDITQNMVSLESHLQSCSSHPCAVMTVSTSDSQLRGRKFSSQPLFHSHVTTLSKSFTNVPSSPSSIIWYRPKGDGALQLGSYGSK